VALQALEPSGKLWTALDSSGQLWKAMGARCLLELESCSESASVPNVQALAAELFDVIIGPRGFPSEDDTKPEAPWGCSRCANRRGFRRGGRSKTLPEHPRSPRRSTPHP